MIIRQMSYQHVLQNLVTEKKFHGQRIDTALQEMMKAYSRSHVQRLIREGLVSINDLPAKKGNRVSEGDVITIREAKLKPSKFLPKNIPLEILFEDQDIVAVNKPAGLLTHPSKFERENTLVNALLHHCGDRLSGIGGEKRPGIVHRLDKDTSGILLIAKHDEAHRDLSRQIEKRLMEKDYLALVKGVPKTMTGMIDAPLGREQKRGKQRIAVSSGKLAKKAVTFFTIRKIFDQGITLLEVRIKTGRMHQIRVHLSSIGLPIIGDSLYGDHEMNEQFKDQFGLAHQFLHAFRLKFFHPRTKKNMAIEAPLPKDLEAVLLSLTPESKG